MSQEPLKTSFTAKLTYLTTEEGGRKGYATSGYRPHVKFPFSDQVTSGQQFFIGYEMVFPGGAVDAEITLLTTKYYEGKLSPGMTFEFAEGNRVVGHGEILKVLDEKLSIQ